MGYETKALASFLQPMRSAVDDSARTTTKAGAQPTPGASALSALAQFSDAQQAMLKGFTPEVLGGWKGKRRARGWANFIIWCWGGGGVSERFGQRAFFVVL